MISSLSATQDLSNRASFGSGIRIKKLANRTKTKIEKMSQVEELSHYQELLVRVQSNDFSLKKYHGNNNQSGQKAFEENIFKSKDGDVLVKSKKARGPEYIEILQKDGNSYRFKKEKRGIVAAKFEELSHALSTKGLWVGYSH